MLIVCTLVPWATSQNFHEWIHRGLVILLTACPCAVVIGAPLATTCAIAAAATRGLLIKKAETVELLQPGFTLCGSPIGSHRSVHVKEVHCELRIGKD